jgi:hypothetical protein
MENTGRTERKPEEEMNNKKYGFLKIVTVFLAGFVIGLLIGLSVISVSKVSNEFRRMGISHRDTMTIQQPVESNDPTPYHVKDASMIMGVVAEFSNIKPALEYMAKGNAFGCYLYRGDKLIASSVGATWYEPGETNIAVFPISKDHEDYVDAKEFADGLKGK